MKRDKKGRFVKMCKPEGTSLPEFDPHTMNAHELRKRRRRRVK